MQWSLASISDVKNPDGLTTNLVSDVVFKTRQEASPNSGRDFRAGKWVLLNLRFPSLILVEERGAQIRGIREFARSSDQFLLSEPVKRNLHRIARRALRNTTADGTPASPSKSI
jgi:hypothetical protein